MAYVELVSRGIGITSKYIGEEPKRLNANIYSPLKKKHTNTGVVLCSSVLWEYQTYYTAFAHLASSLASHGFHVLHFDYYGYGNSEGECRYSSVTQWLDDIACATKELTTGQRLDRIVLVGHRLGGTLALLKCADIDSVEAVVLWDPVSDGSSYIVNMRRLEQTLLLNAMGSISLAITRDRHFITGYPVSEKCLSQIEGIDLLSFNYAKPQRLLLIENPVYDKPSGLHKYFSSIGFSHAYRLFANTESGGEWSLTKSYIPCNILSWIVGWLQEATL